MIYLKLEESLTQTQKIRLLIFSMARLDKFPARERLTLKNRLIMRC